MLAWEEKDRIDVQQLLDLLTVLYFYLFEFRTERYFMFNLFLRLKEERLRMKISK